MYALELAKAEEIALCNEIIRQGRQFQQEQGFVQWTEDYPSIDTLRRDVADCTGYVLRVEGVIAGYMCIDFSGEPAYAEIQGAWGAERPYAVVHRMAFSRDFRGMGLVDTAFPLIETLCLDNGVSYIRVDTDFPNKRMQHILSKNGFTQRGTIVFQGGGKLAYDKILS